MALRRLLLAVLVCAAVGGALSGRALAVTPPLPACAAAGGNELVTQHFNIWYDSDQGQSDYITETKAGDVGGFAEHAYSTFAAMGFPTPVVGASGRIDIEVVDLSNWHRTTVVCTNGQFLLDSKSIGTSDQLMFAIGAGVFSEIEYKQFVPATTDLWLTGAAAQWASALALGYPAVSAADLGPPEMSLDCWDPNYTVDLRKCSAEQAASYENIGLSRWPFFEYLAERFGNMFIDEVLADSASAGSSYQGIANALAAHGTTFSAAFNDWTKTDLSGAYTAAPLQNHVPPTYVTVSTGTVAGTVANKLRVTVDHLATRYVEFDRGDGTGASSCFAAKLSLTVTIPAGSISQPMFYWTGGGGTVVPLSINGSTATATVPWDTCTWGGAKGLLALTNASSNPDVNSANFYVTATMTVDSTTPANAGCPAYTRLRLGPGRSRHVEHVAAGHHPRRKSGPDAVLDRPRAQPDHRIGRAGLGAGEPRLHAARHRERGARHEPGLSHPAERRARHAPPLRGGVGHPHGDSGRSERRRPRTDGDAEGDDRPGGEAEGEAGRKAEEQAEDQDQDEAQDRPQVESAP